MKELVRDLNVRTLDQVQQSSFDGRLLHVAEPEPEALAWTRCSTNNARSNGILLQHLLLALLVTAFEELPKALPICQAPGEGNLTGVNRCLAGSSYPCSRALTYSTGLVTQQEMVNSPGL